MERLVVLVGAEAAEMVSEEELVEKGGFAARDRDEPRGRDRDPNDRGEGDAARGAREPAAESGDACGRQIDGKRHDGAPDERGERDREPRGREPREPRLPLDRLDRHERDRHRERVAEGAVGREGAREDPGERHREEREAGADREARPADPPRESHQRGAGRERGERGHEPERPLGGCAELEAGSAEPRKKRRLLEIQHPGKARCRPVAARHHFARDLRVARLLGKEPGAPQPCEPSRHRDGEEQEGQSPAAQRSRLVTVGRANRTPLPPSISQ